MARADLLLLISAILSFRTSGADIAASAEFVKLLRPRGMREVCVTMTSSSSSKMVSSLVMYNAFKKDGTSSL